MNYLELFSSSCREKPRLMALAQALLRQVADLAACAAAIEPGYAAENAVGVQLDAFGEMIGIPRPPSNNRQLDRSSNGTGSGE